MIGRLGLVISACLITLSGAWADSHSIVGTWTLDVNTPRGLQHPTLVVINEGDSYHGSYTGARGKLDIERIQVDGAAFSFPLTVTMPMGEMQLNYAGKVDGDSVAGEIGNPRGSIPFTGKRAQ